MSSRCSVPPSWLLRTFSERDQPCIYLPSHEPSPNVPFAPRISLFLRQPLRLAPPVPLREAYRLAFRLVPFVPRAESFSAVQPCIRFVKRRGFICAVTPHHLLQLCRTRFSAPRCTLDGPCRVSSLAALGKVFASPASIGSACGSAFTASITGFCHHRRLQRWRRGRPVIGTCLPFVAVVLVFVSYSPALHRAAARGIAPSLMCDHGSLFQPIAVRFASAQHSEHGITSSPTI